MAADVPALLRNVKSLDTRDRRRGPHKKSPRICEGFDFCILISFF